jgi:hypothetical protein
MEPYHQHYITLPYLGFEPGTIGFQVGNATAWAIEVGWVTAGSRTKNLEIPNSYSLIQRFNAEWLQFTKKVLKDST